MYPRGPAGSGGFSRGGAGAPSSALLPMRGRSAPPTPGDFLFEKKVTKDSPGGHPWTPEGGTLSPLRRCRTPQIGLSATTKDRFATLSGWANRSFFSPSYTGGHTSCCQSVARQLPWLRGCLRVLFPATNTARAEGRGIKGGEAPFAGGPGTRRFLVSLCLLSSHKKVGRGAGRSARSRGSWGPKAPTSGSAEGCTGGAAPRKRGSAEGAAPPRKEI